jgi:hypothetical protein
LSEVICQRGNAERELLHRLLAYQTPVPFDGIQKLALPDLANARALLETLLNVSLVEQIDNPKYQTTDYQLSPLVRDWLQQRGPGEPNATLQKKAAEYQAWLLQNERRTIAQAFATHAALSNAGLRDQAQRLVLDRIIEPLNNAGLYRTLLDDWLPPLAEADNLQIRCAALAQISVQHHNLRNFDTSLKYYKQALEIKQKIGDKAGDYDAPLDYLKQSLVIVQSYKPADRLGGRYLQDRLSVTKNNRYKPADHRGGKYWQDRLSVTKNNRCKFADHLGGRYSQDRPGGKAYRHLEKTSRVALSGTSFRARHLHVAICR